MEGGMRGWRVALLLVAGLAAGVPGWTARAEEPWHAVHRRDHRDWTLSVSGGIGFVGLEGDGSFDADQFDSEFSFDGTLDISEITAPWAEVDLQPATGYHLRFAYTPMPFHGTEVLTAPLVVDGETYDAGDQVDTDLRLIQYELSFRSEYWLGEYLSVAPLVQLNLVDAKLEIVNLSQGITATEDTWVPLPQLGLRAELYPLARVGLFAEGKGLPLGSGGSLWDASLGLSVYVSRNFAVTGHYRLAHYEVKFDSEVDVDIAGLRLGATLRF
jgi:hypothetical protein